MSTENLTRSKEGRTLRIGGQADRGLAPRISS